MIAIWTFGGLWNADKAINGIYAYFSVIIYKVTSYYQWNLNKEEHNTRKQKQRKEYIKTQTIKQQQINNAIPLTKYFHKLGIASNFVSQQ